MYLIVLSNVKKPFFLYEMKVCGVNSSFLRIIYHSPHGNGKHGIWGGEDDEHQLHYYINYNSDEHFKESEFETENNEICIQN